MKPRVSCLASLARHEGPQWLHRGRIGIQTCPCPDSMRARAVLAGQTLDGLSFVVTVTLFHYNCDGHTIDDSMPAKKNPDPSDQTPAQRQRGRPKTGSAKSAAERKRDQRQRDKDAIWSSQQDLTQASTIGLCNAMANVVEMKKVEMGEVFLDLIVAELKRRLRDGHK